MAEAARKIETGDVKATQEGKAIFDKRIHVMHSDALGLVDDVAQESLQEVKGDVLARKKIQDSVELSERAIADATKKARNEAKRRAQSSFNEASAYKPREIPVLEILKNVKEPENDNSVRLLHSEIEDKGKALWTLRRSDEYSPEVSEKKVAVAELELRLLKRLEKKSDVTSRREDRVDELGDVNQQIEKVSKIMDDIGSLENNVDVDFDHTEELERERKGLQKKQFNLIEEIDADEAEIFAAGLALSNLDILLSKTKNELSSAEEEEVEEKRRIEKDVTADREEIERLKSIAESSDTEDKKKSGVVSAMDYTGKTVKKGFFGVLAGAGAFLINEVFGISRIFDRIDRLLKWMFQTPFDKKFDFLKKWGKDKEKKNT